MEKRKFLYYNLKDIEKNKNNIIYNYIIDNCIEHSKNSNGLLINLSILPDNHINELYDIYNIKEKTIDYNLPEINIKIKKQEQVEKIKKYKNYQLNKLEKMILSYS